MFKKNSWIVALLLALTLTALFTGCIDALVDEEAGVTYTEVELGDFNVWGGQNYQRGWAVGGMKFLGIGDKVEVAKDLGYKNEDFAKATKLVIEMEDASRPKGTVDIIWGAADANGDSVGQDWIQTGAIKSSKEGNILTIDLKAMKDYTRYKTGNYAMRKLILQAGGDGADLKGLVVKAKLLIPDIEEPALPDEYAIPGNGNYKIPTTPLTDRSEFYVDLNGAYQGAMNKVILDGKIEETQLTFTLAGDDNRAAIFIPFTADFEKLVQGAVNGKYTIDVTIDGSVTTVSGKDAVTYRWFITNNTTANYATSTLITGVIGSGTTTNITLNNQNSTAKGFCFQMTNAKTVDADGNVTLDPQAKVVIKSIIFKFKGPTSVPTPPPAVATDMNITISFPVAGWQPSYTVTNGDLDGVLKFVPDVVFGVFDRNTVYRAEITITPKAGKILPSSGTFTIKNGLDFVPGVAATVSQAVYDPINGIIYTAAFAATSSTDQPSPVEGLFDSDHGSFTQESGSTIVFDLAGTGAGNLGYIKNNYPKGVTGTVTVDSFKAPLQDSQAEKYEFVNNGLNITKASDAGAGDAWKAIDLNFTGKDSLNLDLENKSYKVTVWGNLNVASLPSGVASTRAIFHVPYRGSTKWNSDDVATSPALTDAYATFEIDATITPTDWADWKAEDGTNDSTAGDINRIRIRVEDGRVNFRISRITVEELP